MKTIKIKGMRCGHCKTAVSKALNEISGVSDVHVDLAENTASYSEASPVTPSTIKEAIAKIGFEVED